MIRLFRMFLCICAIVVSVQGFNILALVPMSGKSHWTYMKVFIMELIQRGHHVTCITCNSMNHTIENYTEILVDPPFNMQNIIREEDIFNYEHSAFKAIGMYNLLGSLSPNYVLRHDKVQKFIRSENNSFDLVINEEINHDAFLAFGHKFNAPVVTISPLGVSEYFDRDMGLLTPLSHVSHLMLPYTDEMNFNQRWTNTMLTIYDWFVRKIIYIPRQSQILKNHFGHLNQLPSFDELRKNISVIFVNAHRSITYARPSMPGLVYIGGAHIRSPKPLPADLKTFLDESEHGVIYFSLGTIVNTSKMPAGKIRIFLDTFRKLKQRVIWKFENDSIPNQPENVLIRKWLPQNDILSHPNIVLFISHGGMFSYLEAVHYGIQTLVIPLIVDQYRNAFRTQHAGHGKFVEFRDITDESLLNVLNEMLTDKKYSNRAKEISAVFRDNVVHPMDEFIWWINHVIKFRGAKHLKSHAADMSIFTYLLIDVLLVNVAIVAIVVVGFYYSISWLCFQKKQKSKNE